MKPFPLTALVLVILTATAGHATTNCTFTNSGTTMTLDADCTTDSTILVPDSWTLDGAGNTITALDPSGGHFVGAVVGNAGSTAHVTQLTINTSNLTNVCDAGADRLRGIMFEGASGTITNNVVMNINQGASGCQEGNAIEVRNAPFDGTHPATKVVEVSHNQLSNWQKTGIVANGDVDVTIVHNTVSGSATQANLAANGIQIGFGGKGTVKHNLVDGNSWCCVDAAATAILLFDAESGSEVSQNNVMGGNADVGIYVFADGVTIDNNRVFETGSDGFYDIGVGDYGAGNAVTNNKVRGFALPYDGVTDGKNKVIPSKD